MRRSTRWWPSCCVCAGNASPLAGLEPDEVGGLDGGLAALDDPARRESYASILARAGRDQIVVEAKAPPSDELQHWSMHSHGAMFCEVGVNALTGETRVRRFLGSFDCGRILNAKIRSEPVPRRHHHGPRTGADGGNPVR